METKIAIWISDPHISENNITSTWGFFERIVDVAKKEKVKRLFIGGDIFTSRRGQTDVVLSTFSEILEYLHKKGIETFAFPGNHDKVDYTSDRSYLDSFTHHPGFTLFREPSKITIGFVQFFILPFYDEKLTYLSKLEKLYDLERESGKCSILLTHVGFNGATPNGGHVIKNDIKTDLLDYDTILVGHYHNQHVLDDKIFYTGSCYPVNFGEDSNKGCCIIDKLGGIEFLKIESPEYITVKNTIEELTPEGVQSIIEESTSSIGDHYRVVITGDSLALKNDVRVTLEKAGVKVEVKTEDQIMDPEVAVDIYKTFDNNDIIDYFDQWAKERKPTNLKYGKQILKDQLI